MPGEKITPFSGFHYSVKNKEYQQFLDNKVTALFGNNKTLTFDDFVKKEKILTSVFEKASDKDQEQLNNILGCIFNLDGDGSTINTNEYKTLLTALDAKETDKNKPLSMDGNFEVDGEASGVYSLDQCKDIQPYYRKLNWQKMSDSELLNEMQTNVQKILHGNRGGSGNNEFKLHDIITTIDIYLSQSNLGETMSREKALKACVGDDIIQYNGDNFNEFPQWTPRYWSKNASLYYSKTLGGEPTVIELDPYRKSCDYYIERNGKALQMWYDASMMWSSVIGDR